MNTVKKVVNTVTARAVAGNIVREAQQKRRDSEKKVEMVIKKSVEYSRLKKINEQQKKLGDEERELKKSLEALGGNKYSVRVYGHGDISVTAKTGEMDFEALRDEIIVEVNLNGKTLEQVTKQITARLA